MLCSLRTMTGLTAASLLLTLSPHADGGIIWVSNLDEGLDTIAIFGGADGQNAISFTTDNNTYTLDSLQTQVNNGAGGTADIGLTLHADNGGQPGSVIEDLGSTTVSLASTTIDLSYASAGTALSANTTYWCVVSRTGDNTFSLAGNNSTDETSPGSWSIGSPVLNTQDGTTWSDFIPTFALAVEATADPIVIAVPEPSCLAWLSVGCLTWIGRRGRTTVRRRPAAH